MAEREGNPPEPDDDYAPLPDEPLSDRPDLLTDEGREQSARLVDEGAGVSDTEKDEVGELGEDEDEDEAGDLSAEEAAVRIEGDPKGLADGPDRYVEESDTP